MLASLFLAVMLAVAPPPRALSDFNPPDVLTPVSGFATFVPGPGVKDVRYIALDGEEPFPVALIGGDPKAFLFLTRGLPEKNYRFIGVASDSQGLLTQKAFAVRVGKPPVTPKEPKDPPAVPKTLYFMIVRDDGPASPAFTKLMANPAWDTLRAAGHTVRDFTSTDAGEFRKSVKVPLPAVLTLSEGADFSTVVREGVALPTSGEGILALPSLK